MDTEAANLPTAMDAASQLADTYAEALLGVVADEQADAVAAELEAVVDLMGRIDGFEQLLTGGRLSRRELSAVVRRVFEGRCSRAAAAFLSVLARRGRLSLLRRTVRSFRAMLDARQGKVAVVAATAAPLDADQQDHVRRSVAQVLGIEPIMKFTVDDGLLGGLVLRVGDRLYDASTAARLRRLAKQLGEALAPRR